MGSRNCGFALLAAVLLAHAPAGGAFDYEDVVELIRSGKLSSVEQVLARLPAEYLENFTLAYRSRSLHESSYDFPRAILFGENAKLILTFNGSDDQSRFEDLEIMQFRDDEQVFELRSISFEDGVSFSGRNPELCRGCHGANPGPIWGSYEYSENNEVMHWPGFYGSTHDAPVLNERENKAFERFRSRAAAHPRYRNLRLRHPLSRWYPYGTGPNKHQFRPNNRLGNLLARLNAKRLAHQLGQRAFYNTHPSLTMLWILNCPAISDPAFDDFIRARFHRRYPPPVDDSPKRVAEALPEDTAHMIRRLLTGPKVLTWNMALASATDERRFSTGIVHIDELVAAELLRTIPAGHWLRDYYVPWTQRDLYDTFKDGYYDANVAPGGVGAEYDAIAPFYDRDSARAACPELARRASAEVLAPKS
jgi:hypothetical protein